MADDEISMDSDVSVMSESTQNEHASSTGEKGDADSSLAELHGEKVLQAVHLPNLGNMTVVIDGEGGALEKSKKRKKRRRRRKNSSRSAPIPGLIKPSKKMAEHSAASARERELITLMEMKQPSSSVMVKGRQSDGSRLGANEASSLDFSDDTSRTIASSLATEDDSSTLASLRSKPNTSKSRKSSSMSSRASASKRRSRSSRVGSSKSDALAWIDDDDMSLQSLISEMSDYDSISAFDENKSFASSRVRGGRKRLQIDDWTSVYPYNQQAPPTSISEVGLRMLSENMQYNDPIARPGANTAYEGMRSDKRGMSVEQTFTMSQEHKLVDVPPLMLNPPSLPEVDEHVSDQNLHLDKVRSALRASKGLGGLRGLRGLRGHTTRAGAGDDSVKDGKDGKGGRDDSSAGGFSAKEIRTVVKFIDNLGEGQGAGDGNIDQGELEHAFRQARRNRANASQQATGATLVKKFEKLLSDNMTNVSAWFSSCDRGGKGGKGDGRLGILEIRAGVQKLAEGTIDSKPWSEGDLIALTRYLDPNGDGDLDIKEFKEGIRRSKETPAAQRFAQRAGAIMGRMESFMVENNMRIKDLFRFIDKDRSGFIVLDELREGLTEMSVSGAEKFALKKEGLVAARKKREEEKKRKLESEVKGRLKILQETGTVKVLSSLDAFMHKTGQRIIDLFGKGGFDKSGDGCLGKAEFYKAMRQLGLECTKKECKELVNLIDQGGDGEIEAYELEKVVRRYRIDMIYIREEQKKKRAAARRAGAHSRGGKSRGGSEGGPESDEWENDFVRMMKEQAMKKDGLLSDLKRKSRMSTASGAAGSRSSSKQGGGGCSCPRSPN